MTDIDLNDFVQKVRAYQRTEYALDNVYQQTLKRRDIWDKLEDIDELKIKDVVLKFLNQWKCRIEYSCASGLAEALRDCSRALIGFNQHSLVEVKLDSLIADSDTIQKVFGKIASVQAGRKTVGATAASKILHMINPSFFMMADKNTRHGYGCYDNELGYMNFMWRMTLFGDAVMREYSAARNVPLNSVFPSLVSECRSASTALPKLLDEYNWVKFNI